MRYFKEVCVVIIMEIVGFRLSRGGNDVGADVVHVLMLVCLGLILATVMFLSLEACFKKSKWYVLLLIGAIACGVTLVVFKGYEDTRKAVAFQLGYIAFGVVCLSVLSGKLMWLFNVICLRVRTIHHAEYPVTQHEHSCGCKPVDPCNDHRCGCAAPQPCNDHRCGCKPVSPCTDHPCGCKPVQPCNNHSCGCKPVSPV